jgi:hypothetical protein
MMWLTSQGVDWCGGFMESSSIFFFDSKKIGERASRPPCGFWTIDDQQLEI